LTLIKIGSLNEEKATKQESVVNLKTKRSDIKIWLVDPTYTQQQISSESMPSAVGGIATFTERNLKLKHPIRLFKYPEKLANALENEIPDIIGFSNYMWNFELSLALARRIKEYAADTVVVMGGPNYPVDHSDQETFLRMHPEIDFYVVGEGEIAFANLTAALTRVDMKKHNMKDELPSVHYIMADGQPNISSSVERIKDLTEIPSPYLEGKLDEFFDGKLQPTIQTTRGCPFACTFCVEGTDYYTKIYRNSQEKTQSELYYIGSKMQEVRNKGGRNDLWLVDSNFGMYNQDLDTCKSISKCQTKYNWPEYIQCDTGKNNKPRVLSAARLVNGAMRISGSVQTLDSDVLKNIKRSNISGDNLMELAVEAAEIDADSRSEIILALPGESLTSHFQTISTVADSGFNHVNTYQLMMLPGTEIDSPETREEYGMKTRFRVLPRCFGYFEVLGKQVIAAEIEEVCISTNTLPFEDYVKCRKMHLLIHIFHNDGLFSSALKFIKFLKLSPYRWLELLFEEEMKDGVKELFDKFEQDTRNELWIKRDELVHNIQNPGIVDSYISGETGYNLLFVHKAIGMGRLVQELKNFAGVTLEKLLAETNKDTEDNLDFLHDALNYNACCISNLFQNIDKTPTSKMKYDIEKFISEDDPVSIAKYLFEKISEIKFVLQDTQKDIITRSLDLYGSNDLGISRVLTKVFVKKILRTGFNPSKSENQTRKIIDSADWPYC
tara:strand:- start:642 stop:2813 length:2172 start_codon:yes stop_codon:yes gene_type:complete